MDPKEKTQKGRSTPERSSHKEAKRSNASPTLWTKSEHDIQSEWVSECELVMPEESHCADGRQMSDEYLKELHRQFFHGVHGEVLTDILDRVLRKSILTLQNPVFFSPSVLSPFMDSVNLLDYDSVYMLGNPVFLPSEKVKRIVEVLRKAGHQSRALVLFHHCLIQSANQPWQGYPQHKKVAQEIQIHALRECGVQAPIVGESSVAGLNAQEALSKMIESLSERIRAPIDPETAEEFICNLSMKPEDVSGEKLNDISKICWQWLVKMKKKCSADKLVEALILTRGLGRYVSDLCYPSNPPEVLSYISKLGDQWLLIPRFLGYKRNELKQLPSLDPLERVKRFVGRMWRVPSCVRRIESILEKLAAFAKVPGLTEFPHISQRKIAAQTIINKRRLFETQKHQATLSSLQQDGTDCTSSVSGDTESQISDGSVVQCKLGQLKRTTATSSDHSLPPDHSQVSSELAAVPEKAARPPNFVGPSVTPGLPVKPPLPQGKDSTATTTIGDDDLFLKACQNPNNVEQVRGLLEGGQTVHVARSSDGAQPLHLAVKCGSPEILECIFRTETVDVDCYTSTFQTPLMWACLAQNLTMVKALVERGANPNTKSSNGYACLHFKETLERPEIVAYLIDEGEAEYDLQTEGENLSPLTRACLIGGAATKSAEYLIRKHANPNGVDGAHMRPLCAAAGGGHEELIKLLINNGAWIDVQNMDGSTPLLKACQHNRLPIVSCLLQHEANLNTVAKDGNTPVMAAVQNNSKELLNKLLPLNPDVNRSMKIGQQNAHPSYYQADRSHMDITPLGLACGRGRQDIVDMLLAKGANINMSSESSLPALSFAILGHRMDVIERLLNDNNLRKGLNDLRPSIMSAIQVGNIPVAERLCNYVGGLEKAMSAATESAYQDLADSLCTLQEMTKGSNRSEQSLPPAPEDVRSKSRPSIPSYYPCSGPSDYVMPGQSLGMMQDPQRRGVVILEEFTQFSIQSVIRDEHGKTLLIETARANGYDDVVGFFEQYLMNPTLIQNVFGEFIRCNSEQQHPSPALFMFENGNFSAEEFQQLLISCGRRDLLAEVELALLAFPATEAIGCRSGSDIVKRLFGTRFYDAVRRQGLPFLDNVDHQQCSAKASGASNVVSSQSRSHPFPQVNQLASPSSTTDQGNQHVTPVQAQLVQSHTSNSEQKVKELRRNLRALSHPRNRSIEQAPHRTFDVSHISNEYFYLKPLASLESAKCSQDHTMPHQDLRETESNGASNSVLVQEDSHSQPVGRSDYMPGSRLSPTNLDTNPTSPHSQGMPNSEHRQLRYQGAHLEQSPTHSPPPFHSDTRTNRQSGFSSDEEATGQRNDSQSSPNLGQPRLQRREGEILTSEVESSEVETGSRSTLSSRPPPSSVSTGPSTTEYPASTSTGASSHGYERSSTVTIDHGTPWPSQNDTPPHLDRSQSQPADSVNSSVRPPMRNAQSEEQTVHSVVFPMPVLCMKLSDAPGDCMLSVLNGLKRSPTKYTHIRISVRHNEKTIIEPFTKIEILEPDDMELFMCWLFQGLIQKLKHVQCTCDDPELKVQMTAIRYSST